MIWTAQRNGALDYVNQRVHEYTGKPFAALEGAGWQSLVHPQDLQYCLTRRERAIKEGEPYENQLRLRRADGEYRWHAVAARPLKDAAGRVLKWLGTWIDVEEQMRAAQVLVRRMREPGPAQSAQRENDQRFRAFLDSMPAIAWIKDSKFRYLWVSASYSRAHGKSLLELRGRDDFEIWPEELARHFRKDDELALRADGPVQSVDSAPYSDGSAARWLVVKFPLPDASDALGVAGIGFDVTADDGDEHGTRRLAAQNPVERLSGRERQVMQLVVDGHTSAQVGERLGLSSKSVDTYRSRLMAKLGIEDLPSLVKFALRHGLTTKR